MNLTPPVTVLLPIYNAAPYLREAVDSVLAQTFTDYELLIINDGSTDDTADILASYKDERITIITQQNIGLIATLNKGLSIAKGKYVARFDADDVCYPDRLKLQYDFLEAHPEYVIIGGEGDYMEEDGTFIYTYKFSAYKDEEIREQGKRYCPFIHSAVMFVKSDVVEVGGYDKGAYTFEDHLLWWQLARKGKMKNFEQALIKVRFNPSSVTIDEKWRGPEFSEIKYKSIEQGFVTDEDADRLREIVASQDMRKFKQGAYYSMIGKKLLWNNYMPAKARKNLRKAISIAPLKIEPYILYLLSYMGERFIKGVYNRYR